MRQEQTRFLFLTSVMDYLKNNNYRIAHHSMSRTKAPLADRNDIKPLLPLANEEIIDIIALDENRKITFVKCMIYEDLVAHFQSDQALLDSLTALAKEETPEFHYIFATTGILTPSLLEDDYSNITDKLVKIDFLQLRYDINSIHKINEPTIYLRKVIGQTRKINRKFEPYPEVCECGTAFMKGTFSINYWGKEKTYNWYICPNCGIEWDDSETAASISNFLTGLSTK